MSPAASRFLGRHPVQRLDERRVERTRESDGLREAGTAHGRVAVQAFLVEDHRDA